MSTSSQQLTALNALVGTWTTESTHPALPGVVVHGTAIVEWLEGERFLIHRSRTDHPDFPDAVSILGCMERDRDEPATSAESESRLRMHYFDSRGVFRIYETSISNEAWRLWREAPGLSQRFTGTFNDGGDTVAGLWQMRPDDVHWEDDLRITYRRRKG